MTQNEQHIITNGRFSASIQYDNDFYGVAMGRVEGNDFIVTRCCGSFKTFKGAERAALRNLNRLA